MNATNKLLDKWAAMRSAKLGAPLKPSAIAHELGLKPGAISNYRAAVSQAAPHIIEKMARDIGENPAGWLALVESERARDAEDRRTWARLARSFGAAATVAAVALLGYGFFDQSAHETIQSAAILNVVGTMHYAKLCRWLARAADALRRLLFKCATDGFDAPPALLA